MCTIMLLYYIVLHNKILYYVIRNYYGYYNCNDKMSCVLNLI